MTSDERDKLALAIGRQRLDFIEDRGTRCDRCLGIGSIVYANTTTWRGGIGGQAMRADVCDRCWFSGIEDAPGPSLRDLDALRTALAQLEGCGDHSCDVAPSSGQGTNGGCRCELPREVRRALRAARRLAGGAR